MATSFDGVALRQGGPRGGGSAHPERKKGSSQFWQLAGKKGWFFTKTPIQGRIYFFETDTRNRRAAQKKDAPRLVFYFRRCRYFQACNLCEYLL